MTEDLEMFGSMTSENKALRLWGDAEKIDTGEKHLRFSLAYLPAWVILPGFTSDIILASGLSEDYEWGRN